jgi:hypothetical protein
VLAAFGKATFIQGQHREERVGRSLLGQDRGRLQGLLDKSTQFITNPVLVGIRLARASVARRRVAAVWRVRQFASRLCVESR